MMGLEENIGILKVTELMIFDNYDRGVLDGNKEVIFKVKTRMLELENRERHGMFSEEREDWRKLRLFIEELEGQFYATRRINDY